MRVVIASTLILGLLTACGSDSSGGGGAGGTSSGGSAGAGGSSSGGSSGAGATGGAAGSNTGGSAGAGTTTPCGPSLVCAQYSVCIVDEVGPYFEYRCEGKGICGATPDCTCLGSTICHGTQICSPVDGKAWEFHCVDS